MDHARVGCDGRIYEIHNVPYLGRNYVEASAGTCMHSSSLSFDLQPVLKGDLLELRPLRSDDYHDLYAVASDPLIWEQHPVGRFRPDVFAEFFDESIASGGALVATDRSNGLVIGSSRFYQYDEEKSEVEIGWTFLSRSYWGGRYNGEMKRLMLEHAFRFVGCVLFLIDPDNLRSQKAAEKIGGIRSAALIEKDGWLYCEYRIVSSAWIAH